MSETKAIWKFDVPVGSKGLCVLAKKILPHVEMSVSGLNVWAEVSAFPPTTSAEVVDSSHELRVVLTGEAIPVEWEWIATTKGSGLVGHLYEIPQEASTND